MNAESEHSHTYTHHDGKHRDRTHTELVHQGTLESNDAIVPDDSDRFKLNDFAHLYHEESMRLIHETEMGFHHSNDGSLIENAYVESMYDDASVKSYTNDNSVGLANGKGSVSFLHHHFESEEAKKVMTLLDNTGPATKSYLHPDDKAIVYNRSNIFPGWLLEDRAWKVAHTGTKSQNEISNILQILPAERTQQQHETLVYWLMSVWETTKNMEYKRVDAMIKEFKYHTYAKNDYIFKEGDRGLTFYIIIEGECSVIKDGIGVVAKLGTGKSFGEIALTQGKDVRTASIQAITEVTVLCLHKLDYDTFVKDIQTQERRENYSLLKSCVLFDDWSRIALQKIADICVKKIYSADQSIYKRGDKCDYVYVVYDGIVKIEKEVQITCINRWPKSIDQWQEYRRKSVKPFRINLLERGSHFGDMDAVQLATGHGTRLDVATAVSMTVTLILIDKLEYLHAIERQKGSINEFKMKVVSDIDILKKIDVLVGGPTSTATIGNAVKLPNKDMFRHVTAKARSYIDPLQQQSSSADKLLVMTSNQLEQLNPRSKYAQSAVVVVGPPTMQSVTSRNQLINTMNAATTTTAATTTAAVASKSMMTKDKKPSTQSTLRPISRSMNFERNAFTASISANTEMVNDRNDMRFVPVHRGIKQFKKFSMVQSGEQYRPISAVVQEFHAKAPSGRVTKYAHSMNLDSIKANYIDKRIDSSNNNSSNNTSNQVNWGNAFAMDTHDTSVHTRPSTSPIKSNLELLHKKKLTYKDVMG